MNNKIDRFKIKAILELQTRFRYLKGVCNKLEADCQFIYRSLFNIMTQVQMNYDKNIISKGKFGTLIEHVESVIEEYKTLPLPLTINRLLGNGKLGDLMVKVKLLEFQLIDLCKNCGMNSCSDILRIMIDREWKSMVPDFYSNLVHFYDKCFIAVKCNIMYDLNNKQNVSVPFVKKPLNLYQISFTEKIDGADIYFPFKDKLLYISGYFKKDPLNITRIGGTLEAKYYKTLSLAKYLHIPQHFKERFLEQMSLRDFLVNDERELVKIISDNYDDFLNYKDKPISLQVKEFVTAKSEIQRKILTLFLISDKDDQIVAHIIYNMISNKSELMRPQPMAEDIYKSLPWCVQKKFKMAYRDVEKRKAELQNIDESDIPYEQRITIMKAPNYIKSKAMDKLKESKGSREASVKAQQYLDTILKIPFGIYQEEEIIQFLNKFSKKLENTIPNLLFETKKSDKIQNSDKKAFIEILEHYNPKIHDTANNIDRFLEELEKITVSVHENINKVNKIVRTSSFCSVEDKDKQLTEFKQLKEKGEEYFYSNSDDQEEFDQEGYDQEGSSDQDGSDQDEDSLGDDHEEKFSKEFYDYMKEKKRVEKDIFNKNIKTYKDEDLHLFELEEKILTLVAEWLEYKREKKAYLKKVDQVMNKCIHGQRDAKKQIQRLIAQWINGKVTGGVFGFEGPPGVGKTSLAKNGLAKCLVDKDGKERPFVFIPLGGSTDGSTLQGHSYTYLGSTWGNIVDGLIASKCMNPIIFFDELDKVSGTQHGREIIGILDHLTDSTQNTEFTDRYFAGIKFDLSKCLIIFTYNNRKNIDPILLDRITEVNYKSLTKHDKLVINDKFMLPEILEMVGFKSDDITFEKDALEYLIDTYTCEAGVRKLKEKLIDIVRELNIKHMMNDDLVLPYKIDKTYIKELFNDKPKMRISKIHKKACIGIVNGLYATDGGVGGILPIEAVKTPSDTKFKLILTGKLGEMMTESVSCAKTLALSLLPKDIYEKINEECKDHPFAIHINARDASVGKEGPSAGISITTVLVSLFSGISIKNDIAMTGEIDLYGNVHAIGGLEAKLSGAKKAGVTLALVPKENEDDYNKIKKRYNETGLELIDVVLVETINDVIKYALVKNDVKFRDING